MFGVTTCPAAALATGELQRTSSHEQANENLLRRLDYLSHKRSEKADPLRVAAAAAFTTDID